MRSATDKKRAANDAPRPLNMTVTEQLPAGMVPGGFAAAFVRIFRDECRERAQARAIAEVAK